VWLAASSHLKGESDMKKFETARKLRHHIDRIREVPPSVRAILILHFLLLLSDSFPLLIVAGVHGGARLAGRDGQAARDGNVDH
jgi:hypothetical protein